MLRKRLEKSTPHAAAFTGVPKHFDLCIYETAVTMCFECPL